MLIRELMSPNPICCAPETPLRRVAQLMKENGCGAIPVCSDGHVVGIVTDRDLVTRGLLLPDPLDVPVSEVMTRNLILVNDDDRVERAVELMESRHVRRLPVMNEELGLVGVISLTDLADHLPERLAGELIREVSDVPKRVRMGK